MVSGSVYVLDVPAFWCLVHLTQSLSAQPLGEVGQRLPPSGIHVDVLLVAAVLIVHDVVVDVMPKRLLGTSRKSFWNSSEK